jgi:hypothetical protein
MLSKIDFSGIVSEHLRTLYDFRTRRASVGDYALFFGFPIVAAVGLTLGGFTITTDGVNILLTSLSIFVGLLFNLLVLAHAMRGGDRAQVRTIHEKQLLREINANLQFAILISLLAICVLLVTVFAPGYALVTVNSARVVRAWIAGVTYVLTTNFLLTLLLILKRMHTLLGIEYRDLEELDATDAKQAAIPGRGETSRPSFGQSLVPHIAER